MTDLLVIDINISNAFFEALQSTLQAFTTWITNQADTGAMVLLEGVILLIRNIGFITTTDLVLVNTLSSLIGAAQVIPLVDAVLRTGLLLGAAAYAGHYYFGWRPISDTIQRWFVTLLLTRLSVQLMDWSLQLMSAITTGIAASIPDFPHIANLNPFLLIGLMLVWAILLFQLVLVSAERIAWLVILKPIAPLAFMTWAIPQSAWVASKYIGLWTGWLIGQFFVILAVAAMELMINRGGIEGYFLSCACLIVAREAITILVPSTTSGSFIKVGPLKI